MEKYYSINDVSLMTGLTTRTIRNYLNMGLLTGEKGEDGAWRFTAENLDTFFKEPYVKDSIRIKNESIVYDFLANRAKKGNRSCVIFDIPATVVEANRLSTFFCEQMENVQDVNFKFGWDRGVARFIISGDEEQVEKIMKNYYDFKKIV